MEATDGEEISGPRVRVQPANVDLPPGRDSHGIVRQSCGTTSGQPYGQQLAPHQHAGESIIVAIGAPFTSALITVWLEVRVLPGPPRILANPEIS